MESTQFQQLEETHTSEFFLKEEDIQKAKNYIEKAAEAAKGLARPNSTQAQMLTLEFEDCEDSNEEYVTQFCKYIQESFRAKNLDHLVPYMTVSRKVRGFFFRPRESFVVEISTVKCD